MAIDPHAGNDRGPQEISGFEDAAAQDHDVFLANLERAGVSDRVRHIRKFSGEALVDVPGEIDVLYIDGAHRLAPALDDIRRWGAKVRPGGDAVDPRLVLVGRGHGSAGGLAVLRVRVPRKVPVASSGSEPPKASVPAAVKTVKQVTRLVRQSPVGKAGAAAQAMVRAGKSSRLAQEVRDKVVVVTGASSGIGEDCALKLAAAGAVVILAARTPQKLAETVARIEQQGGRAFAYACDICRPGRLRPVLQDRAGRALATSTS